MAPSVGAQCAGGTAHRETSLVLALTEDVPQTTPTVGVSLLIAVTFWTTGDAPGETISDNGSVAGTGYSGAPNGTGSAPEVNGPGGFLDDGSFWAMGAQGYAILNPLAIGDEITIDFFGRTVDYARATVFPVFEEIGGTCTPTVDLDGATGATGFWLGGSVSLVQTIAGDPNKLEFANLGAFETPGVTAIAFTDSGLTVLDSWVDDGPGSVSYILGYRAITADDDYDCGGSITGASIPGTAKGGVGANAYTGGGGVAYCPVAPTGIPLFDTVFPV